jgi:hypothetical protein
LYHLLHNVHCECTRSLIYVTQSQGPYKDKETISWSNALGMRWKLLWHNRNLELIDLKQTWQLIDTKWSKLLAQQCPLMKQKFNIVHSTQNINSKLFYRNMMQHLSSTFNFFFLFVMSFNFTNIKDDLQDNLFWVRLLYGYNFNFSLKICSKFWPLRYPLKSPSLLASSIHNIKEKRCT